MIQRTVRVESIDWLDTKDGKKQYMSAVLTDGEKESKQAIFDSAIQKAIQEARDTDSPLLIELEKKGNFWNVTSAVIMEAEVEAPKPKAKPQTNGDWKGRTEDGMDRRTALMQAVELYKHSVEAGVPFSDEIFDGIFVHFLKLLNPVIAEALKEGGKMR